MQTIPQSSTLLSSLREFGLRPKDWVIQKISALNHTYHVRMAHMSDVDLVLEGWVDRTHPVRFLDLRLDDFSRDARFRL